MKYILISILFISACAPKENTTDQPLDTLKTESQNESITCIKNQDWNPSTLIPSFIPQTMSEVSTEWYFRVYICDSYGQPQRAIYEFNEINRTCYKKRRLLDGVEIDEWTIWCNYYPCENPENEPPLC